MLILTRRIGEVVNIGNDITVKVLGIKGNSIRLGFTAPNTIVILRDELMSTLRQKIPSDPDDEPSAGNA